MKRDVNGGSEPGEKGGEEVWAGDSNTSKMSQGVSYH